MLLTILLCAGRAPPRNTTVDLNSGNIDVPPNMACWASFHNGVAAGLKIAPASQIDSAWIVYNKPKIAELANEYAGFLMALGLNGHLTKLATLNIHDYLTKVSYFFINNREIPEPINFFKQTNKGVSKFL